MKDSKVYWGIKVERYSVTFCEITGEGFIGEHFAIKRARDCATQHGTVSVLREGEVVGIITNDKGNITKQELVITL